jgi:L,D-peptidoglycan transpeptidase YkuD (ErfK/YbiS/YcfS/YnhG family)
MRRTTVTAIRIRPRPGRRTQGWLNVGAHHVPVSLGRTGVLANKREGDGGTPTGLFHPVRVWWRADRGSRPRTLLPIRRIDRRYNRPVKIVPHSVADRLWRDDHLYDIIIEIDHNQRPRIAGRGSAVFIHVARAGFAPTAGCVGLAPRRLRWLLARLRPSTRILIQ